MHVQNCMRIIYVTLVFLIFKRFLAVHSSYAYITHYRTTAVFIISIARSICPSCLNMDATSLTSGTHFAPFCCWTLSKNRFESAVLSSPGGIDTTVVVSIVDTTLLACCLVKVLIVLHTPHRFSIPTISVGTANSPL